MSPRWVRFLFLSFPSQKLIQHGLPAAHKFSPKPDFSSLDAVNREMRSTWERYGQSKLVRLFLSRACIRIPLTIFRSWFTHLGQHPLLCRSPRSPQGRKDLCASSRRIFRDLSLTFAHSGQLSPPGQHQHDPYSRTGGFLRSCRCTFFTLILLARPQCRARTPRLPDVPHAQGMMQPLWNLFGMTPFEGAKTQLYLAGSPEVEEKNYRCVRSRPRAKSTRRSYTDRRECPDEQRHVLCPDCDPRFYDGLRPRRGARRAALETVRGYCRAGLIRRSSPHLIYLTTPLSISLYRCYIQICQQFQSEAKREREGVYC